MLSLATPLAALSLALGGRTLDTTFAIHEWGTFVAVQGSDGAALEGLVHDGHDLPGFVHELVPAEVWIASSPKMETPVIYGYARSPLWIEVDVRFPRGRVTQWYPAASEVNPFGDLASGFVRWGGPRDLRLVPQDSGGSSAMLAAVADEDPWRFSREVAAGVFESGSGDSVERERCLFYRGLGAFALPLAARVGHEERHDQDGGLGRCSVSLVLENAAPEEPLRHLVLIAVWGDRIGARELPDLATPLDLGRVDLDLRPREEALPELARALALELCDSGLHADEAWAMVHTWQDAWLGDDGLRLLYVLPPSFVERELPLRVRARPVDGDPSAPPAEPDELVRVFVGRTEILSPEREAEIERTVVDFVAGAPEERARAQVELARWGRFAIPYADLALRRTENARLACRIAALRDRLRLLP